MAFNVRIFGISGVHQLQTVRPQQFSSDSIYQLVLPPLFRQIVVADVVAVNSLPDATAGVNILRIEIPDQQAIRYEVCPPGQIVAAGNTSMRLEGKQQVYFKTGWILSIIDAAGLP